MQEHVNERFGVTMKDRPFGITVLAVLALVTGILSLVSGLALLGVGGLGAFGTGDGGGAVLALGALTFAMAPVALGVGYGFWAVKSWAWGAGLALYAASLVIAGFAVLMAGVGIVTVAVQVGIAAYVIFSLLQPRMRQAFGR